MTDFTYAVAYIRALEPTLFSATTIEQLLACSTYDQCLQFLQEKGWGRQDQPLTAEAILAAETEKTWEAIGALNNIDMSVFDVLSFPKLYHNLKAAVKQHCTEDRVPNVFYKDTAITGQAMLDILQRKAFGELPGNMEEAAKEAYETLLQTGDGQLCDMIIDRACLEAIHEAGVTSEDEFIRDYAISTVQVSNIKIAARCMVTGKPEEFTIKALAPCDGLNVADMAKAAASGSLLPLLQECGFAEAADAIAESPSAFERWCDNRIIDTIQPQLYDAFSVGPLVAYVLARENEIKTVRIILSGKLNKLPDESIRERVRKMYV